MTTSTSSVSRSTPGISAIHSLLDEIARALYSAQPRGDGSAHEVAAMASVVDGGLNRVFVRARRNVLVRGDASISDEPTATESDRARRRCSDARVREIPDSRICALAIHVVIQEDAWRQLHPPRSAGEPLSGTERHGALCG